MKDKKKKVEDEIRARIQREYSKHVLDDTRRFIAGWKNGTIHVHGIEEAAKACGVKLRSPRFLDRILAAMDEIVLKDED